MEKERKGVLRKMAEWRKCNARKEPVTIELTNIEMTKDRKIADKLLVGWRPWWFLMEVNGRREARVAVNQEKEEVRVRKQMAGMASLDKYFRKQISSKTVTSESTHTTPVTIGMDWEALKPELIVLDSNLCELLSTCLCIEEDIC